jgi:hypothetical protein
MSLDRTDRSTAKETAMDNIITDISGFAVFSEGDLGAAHVAAHRLLDQGDLERGHRLLGAWLLGREGEGSEWVHVQWHQLVFELAAGDVASAAARFRAHVLPAILSGEALTDGPSALWRLTLAAPGLRLEWAPARLAALEYLQAGAPDPYVRLHSLLALAGAGDLVSLDAWVARARPTTAEDQTVLDLGRAFAALVRGDHRRAHALLGAALPGLPAVGGSHAQNELFRRLYRLSDSPHVVALH